MQQSRLKKPIQKLISLVLGICIGLLLCEAGLRMYWFGTDGFSYTRLNSFKVLGVTGFIEPAADSETLYQLKPNLDTIFKFKPFTTNSIGLRDREYEIERPHYISRVAIIGDSFAMGSGVGDDECYPAVLEETFDDSFKDPPEVINFGVGGYNLRNYLGVLKTKVLPYKPDLVVIGFTGGNDIDIPDPRHIKGNFKPRPVRDAFNRSWFKWAVKRWWYGMGAADSIRTPTEDELAFVDQSFGELKAICDQNNIKLAIGYYSLVASGADVQSIQTIAQQRGIPFVNLAQQLMDAAVEDYMAHPLDAHPNAEAHAFFAEALFEFINSEKLLP